MTIVSLGPHADAGFFMNTIGRSSVRPPISAAWSA
jgi:hypothetical protein